MVEGNGLRTCRINLPFLKLVKNDLFRNADAWGGEKRMPFFFFLVAPFLFGKPHFRQKAVVICLQRS